MTIGDRPCLICGHDWEKRVNRSAHAPCGSMRGLPSRTCNLVSDVLLWQWHSCADVRCPYCGESLSTFFCSDVCAAQRGVSHRPLQAPSQTAMQCLRTGAQRHMPTPSTAKSALPRLMRASRTRLPRRTSSQVMRPTLGARPCAIARRPWSRQCTASGYAAELVGQDA